MLRNSVDNFLGPASLLIQPSSLRPLCAVLQLMSNAPTLVNVLCYSTVTNPTKRDASPLHSALLHVLVVSRKCDMH